MYFHEIAGELKTYMSPTGRGGDFVITLVGETLRDPMTEEEERMAANDEFNPLASRMSINMLNQILEGKKFISKARAGLICSRYDGQDFAEEIDNLYDAEKDHLQQFLKRRGLTVEIDELGSAVQDILNQIFHGLSKGIHDVDIVLTIHDPKPSIKNLAGDRIYCEDGKLYIDGDIIELPIRLSDAQIYDFEADYISALCDAYAEVLSRDEVTVDEVSSLPKKYQTNFYDQRKAYLSAESIQRSISEVYEDGENQFDILKADAFDGIKTTYFDDYDNGYRRLLEVLKKISDIQLTKSKLSLIKNLIGNLERLGIVHILVNDKTIISWVDPYAE
ncbi:ABC-three component system protein [Levyella massiliensis]|uniref:ABC-three component system protein n=1 Tax=Levyella massiliensis TaxID=938289 RepID=UPI0023F0339E|nr:ABC-three component system protein [Levyella massiliensis]